MKNFTLALQYEYAPYGITVQLVTPLFVRTKMNNYSTTVMSGGNILIPDVETYTKSAVASLGRTNETTGYWLHGIQVNLLFHLTHVFFSSSHDFFFHYTICIVYIAVWLCEIGTNVGSNNSGSKNEYQISG